MFAICHFFVNLFVQPLTFSVLQPTHLNDYGSSESDQNPTPAPSPRPPPPLLAFTLLPSSHQSKPLQPTGASPDQLKPGRLQRLFSALPQIWGGLQLVNFTLVDWMHQGFGLWPLSRLLNIPVTPFSQAHNNGGFIVTHTLGCAATLCLIAARKLRPRGVLMIEPGPWLSTPTFLEFLQSCPSEQLRELYLKQFRIFSHPSPFQAQFLDAMNMSLPGIEEIQSILDQHLKPDTLLQAAASQTRFFVALADLGQPEELQQKRFMDTGLKTRLGAHCSTLKNADFVTAFSNSAQLADHCAQIVLLSPPPAVAIPSPSH